MKKLIVGALSIALLAGGMSSCKKGENDPFLSLKSRKGRMAGEWTVTKLTSTEVDTPAGGTASTSTTTVDGSTLTMVESSGGNSTTTNGTINTATMSIKKDGTYEQKFDFTITSDQGGITITQQQVMTTTGTWNFLSKVDTYKNKERVIFNATSSVTTSTTTIGGASTSSTSTNTYGDGESSTIYMIDQLKGKQVILKSDYASSDSDGTNTNNQTRTEEMTLDPQG